MKNKKFKLFASLTSLVMVVAVMAVGVWAATSAQAGITGKVNFTATGVQGSVAVLEEGTTASLSGVAFSEGKYVIEQFDLTTSAEDAADGTVAIAYEFADANGDGFITGAEAQFTVKIQIANVGAYAMDYEITFANNDVVADKVTAAADAATGTVEATTGIKDVVITYTLNGHTGAPITNLDIPTATISLVKA